MEIFMSYASIKNISTYCTQKYLTYSKKLNPHRSSDLKSGNTRIENVCETFAQLLACLRYARVFKYTALYTTQRSSQTLRPRGIANLLFTRLACTSENLKIPRSGDKAVASTCVKRGAEARGDLGTRPCGIREESKVGTGPRAR